MNKAVKLKKTPLALILLVTGIGLVIVFFSRQQSSQVGSQSTIQAVTLLGAPLAKAGQFIAALEITHDSASLSFIKATTVPWLEPRLLDQDTVFSARLEKVGEAPRSFEFGVRGLIPQGLSEPLKDHHEVGLGDELSARSVPVLLKLPVVAPPFDLCILNAQGKEILRAVIQGSEGKAP